MAYHRIGDDHEKAIRSQFADGEIGLDSAGFIEPLRVGDRAGVAVDLVGANAIEDRSGVTPLHQQFPHERHVHQDHVLARGAMFRGPKRKSVLASPG